MKSTKIRYGLVALVLIAAFAAAYYYSLQAIPDPSQNLIAWRPFNEGIALAKQSHKKIFVDVYTDWCSWCKKMDSEVYSNKEVARLLNEHFVAIKLNAESNQSVSFNGRNLAESELAQQFGVTGYPTLLFFDQQADPITSIPGYSPSETFSKVLGFVVEDYYKTTTDVFKTSRRWSSVVCTNR